MKSQTHINNINEKKTFQISRSNEVLEIFCKVCDQSIIENDSEYYEYQATLLKRMIKFCMRNVLLIILNLMKLIKY